MAANKQSIWETIEQEFLKISVLFYDETLLQAFKKTALRQRVFFGDGNIGLNITDKTHLKLEKTSL